MATEGSHPRIERMIAEGQRRNDMDHEVPRRFRTSQRVRPTEPEYGSPKDAPHAPQRQQSD